MSAVDINSRDDLRELYRELILDHAKSPRHFGKLAGATHTAEGINPLCGDKLRLYLRLDDEDKIDAASFEGSGCAISVAAASVMTDTIIGLNVSVALEYFRAVTRRLTDPGQDHGDNLDLGKIMAFDGVHEFPSRIKCATLAWHALNCAIHNQTKPASTE